MAKPVASFNFIDSGLTATFTDASANTPTSWQWTFGFEGGTSTSQNPDPIVFPQSGIYNITLVATNAEGPSNPFIMPLVISEIPGLNFTIRQMVLADLPMGISLDTVGFYQNVKKWQLYVQPMVRPIVADEDVFNESKYPPLVNILIAKLIIWELIIKAATSAMIAFANASQVYNSNISNVTASTVLVSDFAIDFNNAVLFAEGQTVKLDLLIIDGITYGPSEFLNESDFLTFLNSLGKGAFIYSEGKLKSLGNSHVLTTFNYTGEVSSANGAFTLTNSRVVSLTSVISSSSGGTTGLGKGPLKKLETGPSNAEWYDASTYWKNMFSGSGSLGSSSSPSGGGSGILQVIQNEICIWAKRTGIKIPFCPQAKRPSLFQVYRKKYC